MCCQAADVEVEDAESYTGNQLGDRSVNPYYQENSAPSGSEPEEPEREESEEEVESEEEPDQDERPVQRKGKVSYYFLICSIYSLLCSGAWCSGTSSAC